MRPTSTVSPRARCSQRSPSVSTPQQKKASAHARPCPSPAANHPVRPVVRCHRRGPGAASGRRLQARGRAQDRVHLRGHRQGRRLERGPGLGARGGRAGARPDRRGHRERAGGGDRAEERDRPLRQARLQHHRGHHLRLQRRHPGGGQAVSQRGFRQRVGHHQRPEPRRVLRPHLPGLVPGRHGCGRGQQDRQAGHPWAGSRWAWSTGM